MMNRDQLCAPQLMSCTYYVFVCVCSVFVRVRVSVCVRARVCVCVCAMCVCVCVCVYVFVGGYLATKFFIGNLPSKGRGWIIIK